MQPDIIRRRGYPSANPEDPGAGPPRKSAQWISQWWVTRRSHKTRWQEEKGVFCFLFFPYSFLVSPPKIKDKLVVDAIVHTSMLPSMARPRTTQLHPESKNLPFRWLKDHLASKYETNCRSASQFFKDVWADGEFAGGNKNRSLVLKDWMQTLMFAPASGIAFGKLDSLTH